MPYSINDNVCVFVKPTDQSPAVIDVGDIVANVATEYDVQEENACTISRRAECDLFTAQEKDEIKRIPHGTYVIIARWKFVDGRHKLDVKHRFTNGGRIIGVK